MGVYFLFREFCALGCVVATTRELSKRYSEHVSKIKNSPQEIQTVHLHFRESKGKCSPKNGILENILNRDEEKLFRMEKWYIKKLKPFFNVKNATFIRNGEMYVVKTQ
jgi:hypothetical protein